MTHSTTQENNVAWRLERTLSKAITLITICSASFLLCTTLFTAPRSTIHNIDDTSRIVFSPLIDTNDKSTAMQSRHYQYQQQQNFHRRLAVAPPIVDDPIDNYLFIIIHYHKTGHDLSRSLIDMISAGIPDIPRPIVWSRKSMITSYSKAVKCPTNVNLPAGNILVLTAPNFFCDPTMLAEILLSERDSSSIFRRNKFATRGVKIIHLIRNPFSLAVSNYNYHAQDPTPESWVYRTNPCKVEMLRGQSYRDLLLPTLASIMKEDDFQALKDRCNFLFRNPQRPELKGEHMFAHLQQLEPKLGVQLSTLHMLTQGVSGGDITRMVSNILKFSNLKRLVSHTNALHHIPTNKPNHDLIQVMSLSTDDFIVDPHGMALRVLDFCFGNNVSEDIRKKIAFKYEQSYMTLQEGGGDIHVTHKIDNTDILKDSLRKDELFGRILGNLENVVEMALEESRG
ncbi:hypothetical protein HJC23_008273 [Cyclotella cryptica]|uniref:Sulfotransferase domain-containing protein n=1 Tax=Cyclotella cryptica TaxID=29204 RepID=A0ABD3PCQ3_9STRA